MKLYEPSAPPPPDRPPPYPLLRYIPRTEITLPPVSRKIAFVIAIFLLTGGSVISVRGIYRRSGYGGGRSGGGGAEGSYNFMRRPVRRRNFQGLRPRQHRSTTHRSVTTIDQHSHAAIGRL